MIYKLQKRFILISALSVFLVVALVFVLISALNVSSMNRTLDSLADSLSLGNGEFPDGFGGARPQPDKQGSDIGGMGMGFITPETRFSTRHFTVWLDFEGNVTESNLDYIYSISEEVASEYAKKAQQDNGDRGWISNYRYKVFDTYEGVGVVFVDGSVNRASLLQSLLTVGLVLLGCALVVIFLIIVFSKRVMKPVAESYEKQKQFITDANHELKTPLTLILTNLDIAEAELGQNEWLDDIRTEGRRMTALVNQLVALSRMDEEMPIDEKELSLSDIVKDTVSEFSALISENGKTLTSDIDVGIIYGADEVLIRRLVSILMDNAVKYCDDGGDICVTMKQKKNIVLTVENSYHAIDSVELDRLFDRFYRADKARTYTGGFGIGLSIAKMIVDKHRGEISAYRKDEGHIGFRIVLKP